MVKLTNFKKRLFAKRLLSLVIVMVLLAMLFHYREWIRYQIQVVLMYSVEFKFWEIVLLGALAYTAGFLYQKLFNKTDQYAQGYIEGYNMTKKLMARSQLLRSRTGPSLEEFEQQFDEMMGEEDG